MVTLNVLKFILRGPTMRIDCRRVAGVGKLVFPIHMSDSRLQIVPRSPKKIYGAWSSTYICRHALRLYFRGDLQVCRGAEWLSCILSQNVTLNSGSIVTARSFVFDAFCHAL
jgi:hypothetical protein